MDIDDVFGHRTNSQMYHWIKENLDFDQNFLKLLFYKEYIFELTLQYQ